MMGGAIDDLVAEALPSGGLKTSSRLKIGVFGAGAIGCYLGGRLAAAGEDVVMVGRLGGEIASHGLTITDLGGRRDVVPAERVAYAGDAAALADRDVVLVTVKSMATRAAAAALAGVLAPGAIVVSFQNGVSNVEVLRAGLGARVVAAGMVPFNVVHAVGTGSFQQTTSGPLGVERAAGEGLVAALRGAGLDVKAYENLGALAWSKLLVNLNNSVNALAGVPLVRELGQRDYRRVLALAFAEGLRSLRAAGLPTVRVGRMIPALTPTVLRLPDRLFFKVAATMVKIDPEARSSMLDDLERGRATEVDFLNGEVVRLGERHGVPVPVNRKIVALVHAAEAARRGSPKLSAAELLAAVQAG